MSEVSCKMFAVCLWWLDAHGIPRSRLTEGTSLRLADLENPRNRVAWDDFTKVLDRFERAVGGPEVLFEVGRSVLTGPLDSLPARLTQLVFDRRRLYELNNRLFGPLMFSNIRARFRVVSPDRFDLELTIPEPYRDCPAFLRITQGTLTQMPCALGYPPSRVSMDISPRRAVYQIELPEVPRRTFSRRWARHLRVLMQSNRIVEDLAVMQDLIGANLDELRAAHREIELQKVRMQNQIHELEQLRDALSQSEARWRALVQSAPDFIATVSRQGTIEFVNRQVEGADGSLVGTNVADHLDPDQVDALMRALDTVFRTGRSLTEALLLCWQGKFWFSVFIGPVHTDGRVTAATIVARDVTRARRVEHERAELERQVLHAQKLESLGVLAGGIAHDFNNILMGVSGNAELLDANVAPDSPARIYLRRIEAGVQRASDLTAQMLAYAGRGRLMSGPVDLSGSVRQLVELLTSAVQKGVRLRFQLADDLPMVQGDATQLQQIAMNLVTNAAESIPGGVGTVTVATSVHDIVDPEAAHTDTGELPLGRYVVLSVADTGSGIAPDVRSRMFEPFFTTRGRGRGLGLSAVLGIVNRHRGGLAMTTELERGTQFRIFLPIDAESVAPSGAAPDPVLPSRVETGAVLVVDDEPTLRDFARDFLGRVGYRVLTAADGEEGMAVYLRERDRIVAVVLDLTLPGRSGLDVFREMRRLDPVAKIIIASGYDPVEAASELENDQHSAFLRKPFRGAELLQTLRGL